jgi:hypothetical protein
MRAKSTADSWQHLLCGHFSCRDALSGTIEIERPYLAGTEANHDVRWVLGKPQLADAVLYDVERTREDAESADAGIIP